MKFNLLHPNRLSTALVLVTLASSLPQATANDDEPGAGHEAFIKGLREGESTDLVSDAKVKSASKLRSLSPVVSRFKGWFIDVTEKTRESKLDGVEVAEGLSLASKSADTSYWQFVETEKGYLVVATAGKYKGWVIARDDSAQTRPEGPNLTVVPALRLSEKVTDNSHWDLTLTGKGLVLKANSGKYEGWAWDFGGGDPSHPESGREVAVNVLLAERVVAGSYFEVRPAPGAEVPLPKEVLSESPLYEVWEEEVPNGQIAVAMDGTVLIFKGHGARSEDPKFITVKRSEDGGRTWSEEKRIGETVKVDGDMSDDGRYPHNEWTHLGNVTVDETTGDIMVFMSTLKTAQKLYRSKDHGKTWKMEDTTIKAGKDGWMPATNGACDPGVTIKYGPKKGRLLMPARVFPEYLNKGKNRKRFNDLYAMALYSDDHGKTWNSSAPFPISGTGESGLVELKDGTVYHNSRTHMRPGNRRIAYSKDAGETWFGEHEDDELFDGPPDEYGCKAALARLRYDDRDILLFCSPGLKDKRHDFTVWVSSDGGNSWPRKKLIKSGPGNYPWMAVGRQGTPSENLVYVLAGKDWCARFNLAWLFSGSEDRPAVGK